MSETEEDQETLRDMFALGSLIAMGAWTPRREGDGMSVIFSNAEQQERRAEYAYAQADAMMVARKRQGRT